MTAFSRRTCILATLAAAACLAADEARNGSVRWRQHDIRRPKPPVRRARDGDDRGQAAERGGRPVRRFEPRGLEVGRGRSRELEGGGRLPRNRAGNRVLSRRRAKFGDIQLHVEWAAPNPPDGVGQDRGNSGIFLMGQFEIQVLDSYKADTYADGQAGAIYGQYPPAVQRVSSARANGRPTTSPFADLGSTPSGKLLEAGARDPLPQRHPRPEQRGTVRSDLLAQVVSRTTDSGRSRPDLAPGSRPSRSLPEHLAPSSFPNDPRRRLGISHVPSWSRSRPSFSIDTPESINRAPSQGPLRQRSRAKAGIS